LSIYLACGLLIDSELKLPLAPAPVLTGNADVRVFRDAVPLPFHGASDCANWEVTDRQVLFRVAGIVRFVISAAREVRFELEGRANDADAIPFLLSTALGALLHQRKLLALHAGAVSLNGQAIALCGPAGVGKSTLIASLCASGCELLGDDVSVIQRDASGRPWLLSDGRHHQLWADSIEQLHLTERQGPPIREGLRKFHVAPAKATYPASLPLKTIVLLRGLSQPARSRVCPLQPADAMAALMRTIFCPSLATSLKCDGLLFTQIAATLPWVQVLCLDRHSRFQNLTNDVQRLLEHLQ